MGQAAAGVRVGNRKSTEFVFEPLEPRLLMSADPVLGVASAMEPVVIAVTEPTVISAGLLDDSTPVTLTVQQEPTPIGSAAAEETQARHEVVFVDTRVEDCEQFLEDFLSQSSGERRIEVYLLDPARDGIDQISQTLAGYSGLDAVHFISHGTDGAVQLGATWLDRNSLTAMADSIAGWSRSLSADADLLFYGCDLAASPLGVAFLEQLSLLTGADVAASVNRTGAAELGGDWNLEFFSGPIETSVVLSAQAQSQWQSVLETAVGTEFRINTTTTGAQQTFAENPGAVAMAPNGSFVVTWASQGQDGSGWGIYAQRYSAAGTALGAEFRVNNTTTGDQSAPTLAMDANGNFVITWSSTQTGSGNDIFARRYDLNGNALGSEFLVNTYTTGHQQYSSIAMDPSGNFVVAWSSQNQDGNSWGIFAQRYNSSGVAQGSEFQVNTFTTNVQQDARVGMGSVGNFVITWSSQNQDGSSWGVYAQRYNAAGVAQGSEFLVNTTTTGQQINPAVAVAPNGSFVITWQSNTDAATWGVYAQRYNTAGVAQGGEFLVNTTSTNDQRDPFVAMDSTGNFVISWSSFQNGVDWDVYARQYNAAGIAQGAEFRVNTTTTSDQQFASVAAGTGKFAVVWSSLNQDGSGYGVYGQLYSTSTNNSPPTATNLNAAESYTEDTPLNLTDIVISDVDSPNVTATLTLSAPAAGSLNTATSGSVTSTYNAGTGVWTASGAIADVNALLAGLTFTPALNYNSNFTIATRVSDGVAPAITGTKNMTGTAVNDAPTASSLSTGETYTQDTPLNLVNIVISDVDSPNVTATLTLSDALAGSLNAGASGAVTSTYIAATGVWSASGAIADVNALLAGLTFTPAPAYNNNFTIATSVDDGAAAPITGVKNMTGIAVNNAPMATNLSVPETYTEDTPLDLTDIVITDVDSPNVTATLTLSDVSAGSLNIATSGPVTSTYVAATGVWTASGAIADVNTLLAGLTFTPTLNYNANFTIATSVDDGVAAPITGVKNMTGIAVNDAPTASNLSAPETYTEDTQLNLTDIVGSDVDSTDVTVTLTLSDVGAGSLSTDTSGLVTSTYDSITGTWTASGAIADVNALLAGLTFTPTLKYDSDFTIATSVDDGVAAPVTGVKNMTGTAVNDAPQASNLSAGETYTEDTPLNLTDIVVSDVDSPDVTVTLTLSDVAAGSLSTGTSGLVTSTYDSITGTWTASGAIADVNALLAGLTFTPTLNYNANFTIATSVDDGVAAPITGVKNMNGTAVNDAPRASNLSAGETYTEDTPLNLTDIVVSDVDSANVTVTLTLSDINAGSLNTGTSGSVTAIYTAGIGVWSASGAIADVNTLLAGLTFTPALNYNANFTIATSVNDGVAAPVTGVKNMTGTVANDAPVLVNNRMTVTQGDSVVLTSAELSATDVDNVDAGLFFSVSGVSAGQFELVASPGVAITSFTQAQVTGGAVRFVHDGGTAAPSYDVTVSDGTLSDGPSSVTLRFRRLDETGAPIPLPPLSETSGSPPVKEAVSESRSEPQPNLVNPPSAFIATSDDGADDASSITPELVQEEFQPVVNTTDALDGAALSPAPSRMVYKQSGEKPVVMTVGSEASSVTRDTELTETTTGTLASADLSSIMDVGNFVQELNKLRDEVSEETYLEKIVVGSTLTTVSGFSIGYVLWLVRGEILITSLLASLPAWRLIDPLPVLSFLAKRSDEDEEDDSVEAAVKKGSSTARPLPVPKQQGGTRSIKWRMVMQPMDAIPENSL